MPRKGDQNSWLYGSAHDQTYWPSAHGGICRVMDAEGRLIAEIDPKTRIRKPIRDDAS